MSKEETVEVIVKVPKRLMELIEKANYFDWNKESFFQICVKCGVSSCLSVMDFNEEKLLTSKYNDKLWTVYPDKKPFA